MRAAVVGHVEWVEFVRGDHVPAAGEIVHATDSCEEPAGGGQWWPRSWRGWREAPR